MKKILFTTLLSLSLNSLFSQKTSPVYLPGKSAGMPDWMNLFYNGVSNALVIEDAYDKYYQTHPFQVSAYTQYYKRWFIENHHFIQADGSIIKPEHGEIRPEGARSSNAAWSLIGPVETYTASWDDPSQPPVSEQVNIYAFDIAASSPNILYACPETGGVFKTTNQGVTWSSVSDSYRLGTLTAIAVQPTNPNIVYAAGSDNVYETTDGGATWTTIFTASNLSCNEILLFADNPNLVLLASGLGLYRSVNGGVSFNLVSGTAGIVYDIESNPVRDSSVYILYQPSGDTLTRFYRSYDAGATINLVSNGWISGTSSDGGRLAVTAADTSYLYAVLLMGGSIDAPVIMRSTNAGTNWTQTCTGTQNNLTGNNSSPLGMSNGQGYYDLGIMVSATDASQVIVGTTTTYKSTDTANTFTALGGYNGTFPFHVDLQFMKMKGNDAWISTDGGLTYSTDFFTTIPNSFARNKGIYGSDFWGYGQGWNEDLVTGGRYHNGNTAMYDGYPAGEALRLGGGESGTGYGFVGRDMHAAHSDIGAYVLPKTFSGNESGFSFVLYPNEDGYGWDASKVEFAPSCYNNMYVGSDSSLWYSIDGGVSYSEIYNFHQRVKKFEVCRSNPQVIYLATQSELYKTTNGGSSWTRILLPSGSSISYLSLTTSYTNDSTIWITSENNSSNKRVFKSTNGGSTWTNLTTPTINGYSYLVVCHQAGTNDGVYISAADYAKVFYRNDTMSDWVDFSAGLPLEFKPVQTKPFYMKNQLRTAGNRGVWETSFYENGLPVAQPTVDKLQSYCLRDTFYFDDFSAVNHALVSWRWSFPGAAYVSDTTVRNPKVVYHTLGAHVATLTVVQSGSVSTDTVTVTTIQNDCVADTVPGNALSINSPGNYAQVPALHLNSNTVTISAWIKPDTTQSDYTGVVFCRSDTTAAGISLMSTNELRYHWNNNYWWVSTGLYFVPNQWNHVALVVTPTQATLYLNGVAFTNLATHNPEPFSVPTLIGMDNNSSGRTFLGQIDEVCIWNRALTQDEIRATRHLTKVPSADTGLIAYYQFDEPNGVVLDKVGTNDGVLTAGATRVISTGPFAGGSSSKLTINTGGVKNFAGTNTGIAFSSASGTVYPNGDVWVSKLNYHPDQPANAYPIVNNYWIVNNYGFDSLFTVIDSIIFNGLPALAITDPTSYYLYKRGANADGATWATPRDTARAYYLNGNNSGLTFAGNAGLTTFGQFSLNAVNILPLGVQAINASTDFQMLTYPNPAKNELFVQINSSGENDYSRINVYDMSGKPILSSRQNISNGKNIVMINIASLAAGVYLVGVEMDGSRKMQKVVIDR